jgi:bifunctional DNA-binding transcriptional regulator/antitoxin component of YhaV-PrlF toxin-antitoxin module
MTDHTQAPSVGYEAAIVRVTSNGSISLPAAIRRRWGVGRVAVIDRGDLAVVRAVPDDPIAFFRGRFAGPGPSTADLREAERRQERAEEKAKQKRVSR